MQRNAPGILRLIPVDEMKLTLAKMALTLVFSVLIYLLLFVITFLIEAVLHLEALPISLVLENLKMRKNNTGQQNYDTD